MDSFDANLSHALNAFGDNRKRKVDLMEKKMMSTQSMATVGVGGSGSLSVAN
ncbi:hypothetical protein U1Q18_032426, partial [Sarracenia purpurea var. burkii]